MLKRTLLYLLTLLLCIACQQDDILPDASHRGTSLTITFRAPSHSTRGIQDLDDDGNVTEAELMRDGQKMYRVSVYLVSGGVVERHQQLEYAQLNDDKTEATVTFDQLDYTKDYQLYAVANHGNYPATGVPSLIGYLSDLPDNQSPQNVTLYTDGTDYICNKAKVYPLTLQKEIHLNPGANTVSGELVRTFARVRINVRNQSTSNDLQLTSLTFPAMAQASANIFAPATSTNYAPLSTSAYAITRFEADMNLAKATDGNVTEKTIFDAYILEGTGGTYSFNLGLRYVGQVASGGYTTDEVAVTEQNDIKDKAMYILYQPNGINSGFVYANGKDNLKWGDTYMDGEGKIDPNYVWQFKKVADNKYALASMGSSGYYIKSAGISFGHIPLTNDNATLNHFLTVEESKYESDKWTFKTASKSTVTDAAYYLYNYGDNEVWAYSSGSDYILYKVVGQSGSSSTVKAESNPTIPINIIDNKTGVATPLTSINRNDFIEITVNASYNEEQGYIKYNTTNWEEGGGDVTFN